MIAPEPNGDARPWPYGIWIPTPDAHDRNVLVPGSNRLPGPDVSLSGRLARGLDDGVGGFLEWLMTPRFVRGT